MSTMEILRKVNVESYGMGLKEQVAAAAVKAHLCESDRQEAAEKLKGVMKATVLKIPALHEKPEFLQTRIEGKVLADLIDTAVTAQIRKIRDEKAGDDSIRGVAVKALEYIDGKRIVEVLSPEFLCFLTDCYRELRY